MRAAPTARFRRGRRDGGSASGSGSSTNLQRAVVEVRQPLEPGGEVPVPLAEQLHRRGEQHAPDDRRVDQDRRGKSDAELLEEQHRQRREDGEHATITTAALVTTPAVDLIPVEIASSIEAPRSNRSRIRLTMNTW